MAGNVADVTVKDNTLVVESNGSAAPIVATVNDGVCTVSVWSANGNPIASIKIIDKETGAEVPVNVMSCAEAIVCSAGIPMEVHLQNLYGHADDAELHLTPGEKQEVETKAGAQEKATAAKNEAIAAASLEIALAKLAAAEDANAKANAALAAARRDIDYVNNKVGAHFYDDRNPHKVTAAQVGLGNVVNKAPNDMQPTFTEASQLEELTSGDRLTVAFGKIAKAVKDLIAHISNKSNPHGVTASQVGAISTPVAVADMDEFTGLFGYVNGPETLNHPISSNFGVVINRSMGINRMQYIFYFASPGIIASRVKLDGAWSGWYRTDINQSTATVED